MRPAWSDESARLVAQGYEFLPRKRAESSDPCVAETRVMGRRTVAVAGPELTRAFYDSERFSRENALPGFVLDSLFGREAVHTLDGTAHRERKGMLTDVLHRDNPRELVERVAAEWDEASLRWQDSGRRLSLHRASAEILFSAACRWMGVPVESQEIGEKTAWMLAMVDGFAPTAPRHLRARRARRRAEDWITGLVQLSRERGGRFSPRWHAIVDHKDGTGAVLSSRVAAVEIINILRPATAISWFVAYAGHALDERPKERERLADPEFATAFAHELRRSYPFVPFLGALPRRDGRLHDVDVRRGDLVLLDVYGQLHDPLWWDDPAEFAPERFMGAMLDAYTLIPQGGGDTRTGHRCPGEDLTIDILSTLAPRLARMRYAVPAQDKRISLRRMPARLPGGFVIERVSVAVD